MKRLANVANLLLVSCAALAQQDAPMPQEQTAPPPQAEHRGPRGERGEMRMRGTAGTISEINGEIGWFYDGVWCAKIGDRHKRNSGGGYVHITP